MKCGIVFLTYALLQILVIKCASEEASLDIHDQEEIDEEPIVENIDSRGEEDKNDDDDEDEEKTSNPGTSNEIEVSREVTNNKTEQLNKISETVDPHYRVEKEAGSPADLLGTNQHYSYPSHYTDFGRRFVPQYLYKQDNKNKLDVDAKGLIPQKASPELVLAVAKDSAILEASKPTNPTDEIIKSDSLRSGDYWNAVWKEDVDPNDLLRTYKDTSREDSDEEQQRPELSAVTLNIMPGSKLYQLVSVLRKISPRFLYVINTKR